MLTHVQYTVLTFAACLQARAIWLSFAGSRKENLRAMQDCWEESSRIGRLAGVLFALSAIPGLIGVFT